jgi:hypothetical protein
MSRAGVLTFQSRVGTTLSAPVAAFHDDGTNFPYDGVGISFEADAVVNRAVVTGLDGDTFTATDAGSIAEYFIQTASITNSLLHEAASALRRLPNTCSTHSPNRVTRPWQPSF